MSAPWEFRAHPGLRPARAERPGATSCAREKRIASEKRLLFFSSRRARRAGRRSGLPARRPRFNSRRCPFPWLNIRHQGDSSPCGQSPMDFESISLAARTQCQCKSISTDLCINGLANNVHLPLHISRVSPAMTQISCGTRRRGEVRLGMYRAQARRISYFPPTASMWFIYSCGAA